MAFIGYGRVSTPDQSLDRQLDELVAHGCERTYAEAASGRRGAYRPQWESCLAHLRAGDTLVVVELSRLGRNTGDLGRLLDDLDQRRIGLQILNLGIDTATPAGRLRSTRWTRASREVTCNGRATPQPKATIATNLTNDGGARDQRHREQPTSPTPGGKR
jgi:hypothetical protein